MLKKFLISLSFIAFTLMIVPAFADDSDLNPEAIPGDENQQQNQMNSSSRAQANNQAPVENPNARPLSAQEEHIIEDSQAQFETEQNNLQPANLTNKNKVNEEDSLAQDKDAIRQARNRLAQEQDESQIKEDKRMLKQSRAKLHQDAEQAEKVEAAEDHISEEQRNLQQYQTANTNTPGRRDW
jgi:hypothetical protein